MNECVHHYIFPPASGPTSKGQCRKCGAEKECLNTLNPEEFILNKEGKEVMKQVRQDYDGRKDEIIATYHRCKENVDKTATALEIPIGTLYGLLYRWGVKERPVRKPKQVKEPLRVHHRQVLPSGPPDPPSSLLKAAELMGGLVPRITQQDHACGGMYQRAWRLFLERIAADGRQQWGKDHIKSLALECMVDAGGRV